MSIEYRKKKLELMRVQTAKEELELKRLERIEEIQRLELHIKAQQETEEKLVKELETIKE
jgi:hypothetical protein